MLTAQHSEPIPTVETTAFIAPTATLTGDIFIGNKTSIWFSAVLNGINGPIHIGDNTILQDLTICIADSHHPVHVGNNVTIGHQSTLKGCRVEDNCMIGMKAVLLEGVIVGHGSIVNAGTLIPEMMVIPPFSIVTGSPGEPMPVVEPLPMGDLRSQVIYRQYASANTDPYRFISLTDYRL